MQNHFVTFKFKALGHQRFEVAGTAGNFKDLFAGAAPKVVVVPLADQLVA